MQKEEEEEEEEEEDGALGQRISHWPPGLKTAEREMKQNNGGLRQYCSGCLWSQKEATEYTHILRSVSLLHRISIVHTHIYSMGGKDRKNMLGPLYFIKSFRSCWGYFYIVSSSTNPIKKRPKTNIHWSSSYEHFPDSNSLIWFIPFSCWPKTQKSASPWVDPPLKIVSNKCPVFSCLSNVC